ncbi:hypothetical protein IY145_11630 [Methylosinus sp. H3A]|uniref:tetratricopeptide repeat protein n=1 Tax=Methylosinus sp. H3A TaxID=2785786 RepID=UPI0018C2D5B6|nr:hypothetical protein [Methylosinus sp. H3A]MBG0810028.1 hypothetical protein [Methylosinus sp. H3A]
MAFFLVICFLAWRIICHAASALLTPHDPRAALAWDAVDPAAFTNLAQDELAKTGDAHSRLAKDAAARLLAVDPLAPGALSLYGKAIAQLGDAARADKILRVAAAHLPIDLVAHAWLYDRALETGRLFEALPELDMLLRARPSLAPRLAPSVQALLEAGDAVEVRFFRLLATAPPWRAALLAQLAERLQNPNALIRLFGRLQASTARPSTDEMGLYLARLLRDGLYDEAYSAWLVHLPPDRLSRLGLLYNGRFQFPVSNLPFDWMFTPVSGASIAVAEDEERKSLSVEFYGARVAFANVSHLLMLAPGRYSFSGAGETDDLENELGLRWRIYCAPKPSETLATTQLWKNTIPLRAFRIEFSVPNSGCEAQWLKLEIPVRVALDADVSGSARYVNLAIESVVK